eukprot:TRINITY_DN13950_c1_g1_i3.p1 TRINITY_DN13950_c1_g1~~TRINITY_DN13950_c1_g1_i3.p1  ORF type:complete len:427 (-),score=87.54 TRINITY_DN13950_c1_g1_i3:1179-2396(-)
MKAQLYNDGSVAAKACVSLVDYLGLDGHVEIKEQESKLMLCTEEHCIMETATIARFLCQILPEGQKLLGESAETQALVNEWSTIAVNSFSGVTDAALSQVNLQLQDKVYAVGSLLTLPDFLLYAMLHDSIILIPAAQIYAFCHLLRWFDLLQNTVLNSCRQFEKTIIPKPRFQKPIIVEDQSRKPVKTEKDDKKAEDQDKKKEEGKDQKQTAEKKQQDTSKKQKEEAKPKKQKEEVKKVDEGRVDQLDIRVGKILEVEKHPNADALFVEQIDLGEGKPRQIISGLVKFISKEEMLNRFVLVITNLKPAKMRDLMSNGMVLCASNEEHTEVVPVVVPEGVAPGEKISVEGYANEPDKEINNAKKKTLDKIFPDLKTSADGKAQYKGVDLMTSKGPVTSSLPNAWIK